MNAKQARLALALGTAFSATALMPQMAQAGDNPFVMIGDVPSYKIGATESSCGAKKAQSSCAAKKAQSSCAAKKAQSSCSAKKAESSCSASK